MSKKSNVIYIGVNPNLVWVEQVNTFVISEKHLLDKNIKPWKSKDGNKLMYQLYNPSTGSRTVYTRPNDQELLVDDLPYNKYLPETDDETIKQTQLHILHSF
jgi:hypothetical protein